MRPNTNPVLAALAQARMRAAPMFVKWCELNGLSPCPAAPAHVARFVVDCAPLGIERLLPAVQDISRLHVSVGVVRNLLTARAPASPCAQYLELDTKAQPAAGWKRRNSKMSLYKWSQTAANNATADSSINWQEGQAPSSVNDSGRAMMASIA